MIEPGLNFNNLDPTTGKFPDVQVEYEDLKFDLNTIDLNPIEEDKFRHLPDFFKDLVNRLSPVEFVGQGDNDPYPKQFKIQGVDHLINQCKESGLDIVIQGNFYNFTGTHWQSIEKKDLQEFLQLAIVKLGIPRNIGIDAEFVKRYEEQFVARITKVIMNSPDVIRVNFLNGTCHIDKDGFRVFEDHNKSDYLTYCLPVDYDQEAKCPEFQKFFDRILPDTDSQKVIFEHIGLSFLPRSLFNLEKIIILYGQGDDGKSTFQKILLALFDKNNVASLTLKDLENENRVAMLKDKILNYGADINFKSVNLEIYKRACSGESLIGRFLYNNAFEINIPVLMFNTNNLPRNVEHTHAFFKRLAIVRFDHPISKKEMELGLSERIKETELPGIFNLIMKGMDRLIHNKNYTSSEKIKEETDRLVRKTDYVLGFLRDNNFVKDSSSTYPLKGLYQEYCRYVDEMGGQALSQANMREIMEERHRIQFKRQNSGYVALIIKNQEEECPF